CGDPNHLIGECPKPPKDKNERVRGSWSDSGDEDNEKVNNETCLVAQASSEICLGVDLEPDEWIKDSGCSKHMTGNRKLFSSYKAYNGGNVIFGSNLRGNIIGKGTISNDSLKIDNVEHVDNLRFKCRVTFSEHDSEITKDGKIIAYKELVRNLPKLKFDQHFYNACEIGKQAHASHKAKNIVSMTRCLELLHMDLFGPSAVRSYGGNRYTLVIVDDYSREFDNKVQFGEFCNANGITHNFSALRTPQSNGVVERKNKTLQEMSRTMLNEQSLPQKFWCNVVDTSTYILNRILIRAILGKTPYELLRVARLELIRILLAYACALDFKLFQIDVKSAFLNGFINEEVYVAQPPGFIDFEKLDHVYKLKKALYGLKQAPKAWYDRLKAFLIKGEYKMGMVDNTLFTKKKGSNLIIVQIYVDDIIFGSTCQDMCDEFAKIMHDEFEISMMGELNFFLGLQIKQRKMKQTALAISTTEAEYVSAGKACQQALWMKQALIDYDVRLDDVPIMCDNKGAIDLSKNPVQHSRTKHIEIRHHFLRDNVQKGHISIEKVSSVDNIADILTKPLKRESFNYLRLGLGMMEHIP
ncbi:retrovirus-related pol polyprotein from transposon TNT 1-94, partial [Tanacetum coccineum]